ncbi:MAG: aminoacyl-tRNA hydrolase [Candidatus Saccharimonadales bacterium]
MKRPQVSDPTMFYTIGLNKTVLIVGLGNPGKEYKLTRHNVGFLCIEAFVDGTSEMGDWIIKKELKCLLSTGQVGDVRVLVAKPTTYMNNAGESVMAICNFYKVQPDNILVVHDELDIDFGTIRLRTGGSSAGHNGIKSVSDRIGENYGRVRVGIGPKKPARIKSEDFVLGKFSENELSQLPNLVREATAIISEYIYGNELPNETRNFLV